MLSGYQNSLGAFVGPTKVMISANTLQVKDYEKYGWTMFDAEEKKARHETIFPIEKQKAFSLGTQMVNNPWKD